ncbi:putative endonuclease 4 (plasmid) [Mesomycoplasma conjunctivae]|nr:deoxyribonuclease IV [Mycoplasmopsis fermentans]ADV34775.1 Probable endonuclease 4 [Mycoplasmopsis fermentans M64]VEU63765.1 putative endonuclease 4 [Mycoplasmopsis fermentans]VEU67246.1 putative endonuclease 4 [Mesomycoplasma conjunctivae]
MIKLGSHISFKSPDYLVGSIKESLKNKANCTMIYLGAPQNAKRVDTKVYKYEEYKANYSNLIKPEDIVVHAPYIINPSSKDKVKNAFAVDFLIKEIQRMNYIGVKYLVLHPGAYTTYELQESLAQLVKSLKEVLAKTKDVVICIETMSGKGTEVGTNFAQLRYLIDELANDRLQICLDTCHVWDAGYNIKNYQEFKSEINKYNLLKHIKVIHLNDSKNDLNSHKDRHENIDKGFIGIDTLAKFVHDKDFDNVPIILETPIPENGPIYDQEIAALLAYKK